MAPRRRRRLWLGLVVAVLVAFGLGATLAEYRWCAGYADASLYRLPYPAGQRYPVHQANCTFGGHHGAYRYSYDFLMPVGARVTAARAGLVVEVRDSFPDGGPFENLVKVQHADGTIAAYAHLHSALARVGQRVAAGDTLGLSGNSGQTGGVPHLHFHVAACLEPRDCGTLPVTFSNTDPHPGGLRQGLVYPAR